MNRVTELRQKTRLSESDVALKIGISIASYRDLEFGDELFDCVSIAKIVELAAVLSCRPSDLFSENFSGHDVAPEELKRKLRDALERSKLDIEQFEHRLGWEIQTFLRKPEIVLLKWNVECLRAVCGVSECNWLAVLNGVPLGPS